MRVYIEWYTRRYVENELRRYKDTKKEYDELRQDILDESPAPPDGMPRGSETSDSTHKRAVKLISTPRLRNMEITIRAIESVLSRLPPEKIEMIELKYWARPQLLTDEGVAIKISCTDRTVRRWTNGIILDIAEEMGLVNYSMSRKK